MIKYRLMLVLLKEQFYKRFTEVNQVVYPDEFYKNILPYLHNQYKYAESTISFKKLFGNDEHIVHITKDNTFNIIPLSGKIGTYKLYSFYVNSSQKEFIDSTLVKLI
ncbi:MAG: hypothetical protein ACPLX8_01250, partial [Nanopusillaceae archaeon]